MPGGINLCQPFELFAKKCIKYIFFLLSATVVVSAGGEVQAVQPSTAAAAEAPTPVELPQFESTGLYRSDGRCGVTFPLEDGLTPAECDPNSDFWCCSEHGYCGGTQEHCYCETCVNYRPVSFLAGNGQVRSDRRCGPDFPLEDGSVSQCDGAGPNHCCSKFGYCGPGPDHCSCVGCVDYRAAVPKAKPLVDGKVRADRRCGSEFPLEDGSPSECDPNGSNFCCSQWGYCGPADHCTCPTCQDYRSNDQKLSQDFIGKVRKDRRCGPEFPLPDGSPSQCDPQSPNFCCSKWGYCGGDDEHCNCPTCFNYKLSSINL